MPSSQFTTAEWHPRGEGAGKLSYFPKLEVPRQGRHEPEPPLIPGVEIPCQKNRSPMLGHPRLQDGELRAKLHLTRKPDLLHAHVGLATIYSELGREEEARAEAAEVLKISPNFSLERWRQQSPYKDPAMLERHIAALRKAGLK